MKGYSFTELAKLVEAAMPRSGGAFSGNVSAPRFIGPLQGNADTATAAGRADKLSTARNITIGSTTKAFDGTGNLSWSLAEIGAINASATVAAANKWATPRALQIGNSSKAVDGTANVAWSLAEIGAVNKAGDTMTGGLTFSTDSELAWVRNTDYAKIGFKNTADSDTDSYMWFRTGDNGNEYFKWQGVSGATTTDWMTLKSSGLTVTGTITAPTFSGALSGNAATATKLATARTLTIGNTGKAFDGTGGVSWTADEMEVFPARVRSDYLAQDPAAWANSLRSGIYTQTYSGASRTVAVFNNSAGSTRTFAISMAYTGQVRFHSNTDANRWLSYDVYTTGNKPTAADVGALPSGSYNPRRDAINATHLMQSYHSNVDLNTRPAGDTGLFEAKSCANSPTPTTTAFYYIETKAIYQNNGDPALLQTAHPYDGSGFFWRNYSLNAKTWTPWYQFYDSKNKPSAADIGAIAAVDGTFTGQLSGPRFWGSFVTAQWGGSPNTITPSDKTFTYHNNIPQGQAGLFPVSNNANGVMTFHNHSGEYYHQLGLSSNGAMYHRGNRTGSWGKVYTEHQKPTAADVGALASGGTAVAATKLATARTLTIGNTGKAFDGTGNVAWSINEIGAAPRGYGLGETTCHMGVSNQFLSYSATPSTGEVPSHGAGWQAAYGSNRRFQFFMNTSNRAYIRYTGSSTVLDNTTGWTELYSTNNKPTAADVGALPSAHSGVSVGPDGTFWGIAGSFNKQYAALTAGANDLDSNGWPNATNNDNNNFINRARVKYKAGNNALYFVADGALNARNWGIQSGHDTANYATAPGALALNPFGGSVRVNSSSPQAEESGVVIDGKQTLTSGKALLYMNGTGAASTQIALRAMREAISATIVWERIGNGQLRYSTGVNANGATSIMLDVGSSTVLAGTLNGTSQVQENGARVYSPNNKPSAADVGLGNVPNTVHTTASTANTVAVRDGSGDVHCRLLRSEFANQTGMSGALAFRINNSNDNYLRFTSDTTAVRNWLGAAAADHSQWRRVASGDVTVAMANHATGSLRATIDTGIKYTQGFVHDASKYRAVIHTNNINSSNPTACTWGAYGTLRALTRWNGPHTIQLDIYSFGSNMNSGNIYRWEVYEVI